MMIKTEDNIEFDTINYGSNLKTRLAEQFKSAQDCGSIVSNKGCVLKNDDDTFTAYKNYTGNTLASAYFDDGGFISTDGTMYLIEQGEQAKNTGYIVSIDVNGYKKRPNKMGYDLFMFQITNDGRVLPMGAEETYWGTESAREARCKKTSTFNENGFTCAYYAMTDNNYFKNLK